MLDLGMNSTASSETIDLGGQFYTCEVLGVSKKDYGYIPIVYEVLICFICIITIPTILANVLILVSIRKNKSLYTPSNVLLSGLALSDLAIGVTVEPLYIISLVAAFRGHVVASCVWREMAYRLGFLFSMATLLTVTTQSIERVLALTLTKQSRTVVSCNRMVKVVVLLWLASASLDALWSWFPAVTLCITAAGLVVCLLINNIAYGRIFHTLRLHQRKTRQMCFSTRNPQNSKKYRKSVFTSLYILVLLFLCSLPYIGRNVSRLTLGYTRNVFILDHVSVAIVYLNSLLNPILYFTRIQDIRSAVLDTIGIRSWNTGLSGRTASTNSIPHLVRGHVSGGKSFQAIISTVV